MDANTYQKEAQRTLLNVPDREIPTEDLQIIWAALRIAVVAGKLVEHLKKGIFHQHGINNDFAASCIDAISDLVTMEDANSIPVPALTDEEIMKLWVTTGLVGEAAEIADNIMLELESGSPGPIFIEGQKKEIGDLAWYWAALSTQYGLSLNDILIGNIEKLQKRYQNGYSAETSKNRKDQS